MSTTSVTLSQLRSFLTLAEELHFHRAAERIGIAQPTLSRHLRSLEDEVGVRLFERTTRHVEITRAGRTLREGVAPAVTRILDTMQDARAVASGDLPLVEVGVSRTARQVLARPAAAIAAPGVHLVHRPGHPQRLLEEVVRGELDAGLTFCPIVTDSLAYEPLGFERVRVALAAGHPLAQQLVVTLSDLAGYRIATFSRERSPGYARAVVAACRRSGFEPRLVEMTDWRGGVPSLHAGNVVALIIGADPEPLGTRLVGVSPPVAFPLAAFWRREDDRPRLRGFVDELRAMAAAHGWLQAAQFGVPLTALAPLGPRRRPEPPAPSASSHRDA